MIGNVEICEISTLDFARYLARYQSFPVAWQIRFCLLERFMEYWSFRGEMQPFPMPPRRSRRLRRFLPYVFSHEEVLQLLRGAASLKRGSNRVIDTRTFQTLIIFSYATGASPSETRSIMRKDLQIKRKLVLVKSERYQDARRVPLGKELCEILRSFAVWRFGSEKGNGNLFVTTEGKPLKADHICNAFSILCRKAGVRRRDGFVEAPRFRDLRSTFAVHRVTSWIQSGADLNRMLPALAAYMGIYNLPLADMYLQMSPERFRKTLDSLSPTRRTLHWQDDPKLMSFINTL